MEEEGHVFVSVFVFFAVFTFLKGQGNMGKIY